MPCPPVHPFTAAFRIPHCPSTQDDDWGVSKYPFVPGHEVVGTVRARGSEVKGLKEGSRVGVGWIKSSCRHCLNCLRGQENICVKGYTGLITHGELGVK